MFAKNKVSQSMIDAVNTVLTIESKKENPQQLNEAFPTVDDAKKRTNAPKPSGGSGIKLGTRYGGGKQADEPEDDEDEKPKAKRSKYGARQQRFTDTKLYKEDDVQEELKGKQHKIDANKNGKVDAHDFQLLRGKKKKVSEEYTFADRLIESMYGKKSALPLDEKEMSDDQKKKREEIVMSMKKDTEGLKKRYGSRWKDVMYATATKQAMKETHNEEVEIEEEIDPKVRTKDSLSGGNKPTNQKDDTGPGSDGRSTKVKFKAGPMDEEKEDEGHEDEAEDKKLVKKMVKKDALKEEELDEEQLDELSKETLSSYLKKRSQPGSNPKGKPLNKSMNTAVNKFNKKSLEEETETKERKLKSFLTMKKEMLGKAGMTSEKKDEE